MPWLVLNISAANHPVSEAVGKILIIAPVPSVILTMVALTICTTEVPPVAGIYFPFSLPELMDTRENILQPVL